ncbi:MAG: hypothetical protein ABI333_18910 [bacterium]
MIAEEKKLYLGRLSKVFEGDPSPKEQLRRWLQIGLTVANEMPIVSKLISGDREIVMFLEEMDTDVRERTER